MAYFSPIIFSEIYFKLLFSCKMRVCHSAAMLKKVEPELSLVHHASVTRVYEGAKTARIGQH